MLEGVAAVKPVFYCSRSLHLQPGALYHNNVRTSRIGVMVLLGVVTERIE